MTQESKQNNKPMWMVRAGEGGILFKIFAEEKIMAVDWSIGDLADAKDRAGIQEKVEIEYRGRSNQAKGAVTAALSKFRFEIENGDWVITYHPETRQYMVGKVMGDYQYAPGQDGGGHVRKVDWHTQAKILRDRLSQPVRFSLGGMSTIFSIGDESKKEILSALENDGQADSAEAPQESEIAELDTPEKNWEAQVNSLIEDKIRQLSPREMEELVHYLLQAMGYSAILTAATKDGGYDVIASPDGLMFEKPRIMAEVKHWQKGKIGTPDMQQFIGAKGDSRGLYVCTGGFSSAAKSEAKNNNVITVDLEQLRQLIVKHYDKFDVEGRMLLPMTKLYLPK